MLLTKYRARLVLPWVAFMLLKSYAVLEIKFAKLFEPLRGLQEKQQKDATLQLKEQMKRTAVVVTTIGVVSQCHEARIRHLVETSGNNTDVWVLHAHHVLEKQGRHEAVQDSWNRMQRIPNLHQEAQEPIQYLPFDELAGSSKSSFLRFLTQHHEYDFAWIVEDDMFFAGAWDDLWKSQLQRDSRTDFYTSRKYSQQNTTWYWIDQTPCQVFGQGCRMVDPQALQVHWMLARVSSRLAHSLLEDVANRHIQGLHEAVVGAYCKQKGFSVGEIDPVRVAKNIRAGHNGATPPSLPFESFQPVLPGTLLHPVKCNPDNGEEIAKEIEKWTASSKKLE